jgi:hypothetical protein
MFHDARERHLNEICDSLWQTFSQPPFSMGDATLGKHLGNLRRNAVIAAADLKQEMACSSSQYVIRNPPPHSTRPLEAQLHESTLMNVVDWRAVGQLQSVGGLFLCLYPGVYKRSAKDKELSALAKPVLLTFRQDAAKQLRSCRAREAEQRPGPNQKSEQASVPFSPGAKPADDQAPRASRRTGGKQSERNGSVTAILGGFLTRSTRGRQPDEGLKSKSRSNIDSPGGSPSDSRTKQHKHRKGAHHSKQHSPQTKDAQPATPTAASAAASSDSQARLPPKMSRRASGRDDAQTGDPDATPRSTVRNLRDTTKDVRPPAQRSSEGEDLGEDTTGETSDDTKSINSAAAMYVERGSMAGRQQAGIDP